VVREKLQDGTMRVLAMCHHRTRPHSVLNQQTRPGQKHARACSGCNTEYLRLAVSTHTCFRYQQ